MDPALAPLGWSAFQQDQLDPAERSLTAVRVSSVHRSRLDLLTTTEPLSLTVGATGDFAVGDWLLLQDGQFVRRLDRSSELARDAARIAWTIGSRLWPALEHHRPAVPSMIGRPSGV